MVGRKRGHIGQVVERQRLGQVPGNVILYLIHLLPVGLFRTFFIDSHFIQVFHKKGYGKASVRTGIFATL